jgi:GH15 family glucan-1,4-alpha-glucosidase
VPDIATQQLRRPERTDGYLPIEDYAVIGDGRTLALVGLDGSIDWMCLPDLDAASAFDALLDPIEGGRFVLAPAIRFEAARSYIPDTNVLRTEFVTDRGVVRVTEGVVVDNAQDTPWRELVRWVEGISGAVPMRWHLRPRLGGGQGAVAPDHQADQFIYRRSGLQLGLKAWDAGDPQVRGTDLEAEFEIVEGQRATLALLASDGFALPSPDRHAVERRLNATVELWKDWIAHCSYEGPWQSAVRRSLLAIRLLADGRTGAIAAAGTTSLPEAIGGKRNYDYRFGWVRDLSFTVEALLRVGMDELSHTSLDWLQSAIRRTHPRVDPVYSLSGDVVRSQRELPLPGYRASQPVNVGNQAGSQLQLGGFGDMVEAICRYAQVGSVLAPETGERVADCVDLLGRIWLNPDAGFWELGDYAHYATSKISCWTAFSRLLDLVEMGQAPARHVAYWRAERDRIRGFIETQLWSEQRNTYLMKTGSDMLDCGVLLAARRGYADPTGPRMRGTIEAIQAELRADGPLYFRYSGMQDKENAFLACSFWMAEALALSHREDEAAEIMDAMVSLSNDVGLYTEEMEPGNHAMRGNFPQALTHLALINAAAIYTQQVSATS